MALDRTEARANRFTEQEAFWEIPMHETNIICDVSVSKGKDVKDLKLTDAELIVCNFIIPLQNECFWEHTGIGLSTRQCIHVSICVSVCVQNTSNFVLQTPPVLLQLY